MFHLADFVTYRRLQFPKGEAFIGLLQVGWTL